MQTTTPTPRMKVAMLRKWTEEVKALEVRKKRETLSTAQHSPRFPAKPNTITQRDPGQPVPVRPPPSSNRAPSNTKILPLAKLPDAPVAASPPGHKIKPKHHVFAAFANYSLHTFAPTPAAHLSELLCAFCSSRQRKSAMENLLLTRKSWPASGLVLCVAGSFCEVLALCLRATKRQSNFLCAAISHLPERDLSLG